MRLQKRISGLLATLKGVLPYLFRRGVGAKNYVEEYPDKISSRMSVDLAQRARGFLRNDLNVCTGCGDCERLCPPHAIQMDAEIREDGSAQVKRFVIDLGKCVNCSLCVEICPVKSITHSRDYELQAFKRDDLLLDFGSEGFSEATRKAQVLKKVRMIRAYEVRR